jgi:hypothetical protein
VSATSQKGKNDKMPSTDNTSPAVAKKSAKAEKKNLALKRKSGAPFFGAVAATALPVLDTFLTECFAAVSRVQPINEFLQQQTDDSSNDSSSNSGSNLVKGLSLAITFCSPSLVQNTLSHCFTTVPVVGKEQPSSNGTTVAGIDENKDLPVIGVGTMADSPLDESLTNAAISFTFWVVAQLSPSEQQHVTSSLLMPSLVSQIALGPEFFSDSLVAMASKPDLLPVFWGWVSAEDLAALGETMHEGDGSWLQSAILTLEASSSSAASSNNGISMVRTFFAFLANFPGGIRGTLASRVLNLVNILLLDKQGNAENDMVSFLQSWIHLNYVMLAVSKYQLPFSSYDRQALASESTMMMSNLTSIVLRQCVALEDVTTTPLLPSSTTSAFTIVTSLVQRCLLSSPAPAVEVVVPVLISCLSHTSDGDILQILDVVLETLVKCVSEAESDKHKESDASQPGVGAGESFIPYATIVVGDNIPRVTVIAVKSDAPVTAGLIFATIVLLELSKRVENEVRARMTGILAKNILRHRKSSACVLGYLRRLALGKKSCCDSYQCLQQSISSRYQDL